MPYLGPVHSMILFQSSVFSFLGTTGFPCFNSFLSEFLAFQLPSLFPLLSKLDFFLLSLIFKICFLSEKNGGQRKRFFSFLFQPMKFNSVVRLNWVSLYFSTPQNFLFLHSSQHPNSSNNWVTYAKKFPFFMLMSHGSQIPHGVSLFHIFNSQKS
jgi:hypothetical protein